MSKQIRSSRPILSIITFAVAIALSPLNAFCQDQARQQLVQQRNDAAARLKLVTDQLSQVSAQGRDLQARLNAHNANASALSARIDVFNQRLNQIRSLVAGVCVNADVFQSDQIKCVAKRNDTPEAQRLFSLIDQQTADARYISETRAKNLAAKPQLEKEANDMNARLRALRAQKQSLTQQVADLDSRIAASPNPPSNPFNLTVQVKSFIKRFNLLDKTQFDPGSRSCAEAFAGGIVTCGVLLGENPTDGSSGNGNFRLRSELLIRGACSGDKVASWAFSPVEIEAGNEFYFISASADLDRPLVASPAKSGASSIDKVTFSYRMRGQPNVAGNAMMNAAKPRACTYIWHQVQGTLSCKAGTLVPQIAMTGSSFPSRRLWIDGKLIADVTQGPFSNLWRCNSVEPNYIQ